VADDVLVEHGGISASCLQVQVPEQGSADMDRQSVVHEIGGQQPAEVVRREAGAMECRVLFGQFSAAAAEHDQHRRG
jgi:hypothetical protein